MSIIEDLNGLGQALADRGLVIGAGGNISARDGAAGAPAAPGTAR